MLKQLLLGGAAALALAACGSDNSDPGYNSKDQLYCNQSAGPNSTAEVFVNCLDTDDLPISGGCTANIGNVANEHVALAESTPFAWDQAGSVAAGWKCVWAANGQSGVADGTPVVLADGDAWICCVSRP